jgi:hypothetical protein
VPEVVAVMDIAVHMIQEDQLLETPRSTLEVAVVAA